MINKYTQAFASFIELQLIIFILSLPLFIWWGLAVSSMSIIANIIFTPLLTLFLYCSCLFSLCSIFQIPCSFLKVSLHYITNIWNYLLSFSSPTWLIGFSHHMLWLSITLALLIIALYTFYKPKRFQALIILVCCSTFLFTANAFYPKKGTYQITDKSMYVIKTKNKTYLIDNGALCSKKNFYSFIDYTVLPELIKKGGITTIDTLVLCKPHKNLVSAATQFIEQTNIQTVIVTEKQNSYESIKKTLCHKNIDIYAIKKSA